MFFRTIVKVLIIGILFTFTATPAVMAGNADTVVKVSVKDANGNPVSEANVTVTDKDGNEIGSGTTDTAGNYRVVYVGDADSFTATVEHDGETVTETKANGGPKTKIKVRLAEASGTSSQTSTTGRPALLPNPGFAISLAAITGRLRATRVGFGTRWNGFTEVKMGWTRRNMAMNGFSMAVEYWSDQHLWDSMDSLESLAVGSSMVFGSVDPSIQDSLDILYDEDEDRDFDGPPPGWRIGWGLQHRYLHGNGNASASEPIGGTNVANTYITPNPIGGSTGIWLGASGMDATSKSDFWRRDYIASMKMARLFGNYMVSPGIRIKYGDHEQEHDIRLRSPSFTADQFSSDLEYDVDEDRTGAGLTLDAGYKVNNFLSVSGGVGADVVYRDADLTAKQHNRCGACGALSPERDIRLRVTDDESSWTFDADAHAELNLQFSKNFRMGLGIAYEYQNDIAEVDSRDNPADAAPNLDRDSSSNTNYYLQAFGSF